MKKSIVVAALASTLLLQRTPVLTSFGARFGSNGAILLRTGSSQFENVLFLPVAMRNHEIAESGSLNTRVPTPTQVAVATRTPHPEAELPRDTLLSGCVVVERSYQLDDLIEIITTSYDRIGNPAVQIYSSTVDASPVQTVTWGYDDRGDVMVIVYDRNSPTMKNSTKLFTYNSQRRLIRFTNDDDSDGLPEFVTDYSYDSVDRVTAVRLSDASNSVIRQRSFEYDEDGKRVRERVDLNGDGKVDVIVQFTWSDSLLISDVTDNLTNDSLDRRTNYYYDPGRRLIRRDWGFDASGKVTQWNEYAYDASLGVMTWEGAFEFGQLIGEGRYSYDDVGRLTAKRIAAIGRQQTSLFDNWCKN